MADLPNDSTTTATLDVNGTFSSTINFNGDRDWVRIDLAPGEYATVSLTGLGLPDPYLRAYDANGTLVGENDDANGLDSELVVGSPSGGTFYLEASSYEDPETGEATGTGTYRLSAVAATEPSPVDTIESGLARGDNIVTVYFVEAGERSSFEDVFNVPGIERSDGWTQTERDAVMAALRVISNYANITFQPTTDPSADFQMVLDDNEFSSSGFLGYFYQPSGSSYTGQSLGVFNANGFGWETGLQAGGLGFNTVIHEALHGLGLDHPHDGGSVLPGLGNPNAPNFPFGVYGDFELNQNVYTIMSYNAGWNGAPSRSNDFGDAATPMALDIAVLQELYGANTTHNGGNNTYVLDDANQIGTGWSAIWDTGGTDTVLYSGTRDTVIDLRAATLAYEEGGGGFISNAAGVQGGYTIAHGVVIENATSGGGDDMLVGNSANNVLTANGGSDMLIGDAGDDTLNGGAGDDTLSGGTGNDTVNAGSNNDTAYGHSGNDILSASSGTNTLYGSSGNDNINGGSGRDTVFGGSGDDTITGGNGADALYGGRGDDTIDGGAGADEIVGGMGSDIMTGGADGDIFIFNAISDSRINNRDEILDFDAGIDLIDLAMIDADLAQAGNQSLTFTAGGAPTVTNGEIWATTGPSETTVYVDQDGDGNADMAITLEGFMAPLSEGDFIL